MPSPEENKNNQPWNPETAVPLFAELAQMQLDSGIFDAYVHSLAEYIQDADPEDAEATRRALYTELPLGVLMDFNDSEDGNPQMALIKVNPYDGSKLEESYSAIGYSVSGVDEEIYRTYGPEGARAFTPEQAALLYEQYKLQEQNGAHIDPEL